MKAITPSKRLLTSSFVAALFAMAILSAFAGAAIAASASTGGSCPNAKDITDFVEADNVAAIFSNTGNTTTYKFISLTDESSINAGLIKYCVYPNPAAQPSSINVQAKDPDGDLWLYSVSPRNFSFVRPGGNKTNIPLDGTTTVMGTATWKTVPTDQIILLHINDPGCALIFTAAKARAPASLNQQMRSVMSATAKPTQLTTRCLLVPPTV